jgi:hypothetical protein
MIEITNKKKYPVQVIIKSTKIPNSFTCLNIPGIGKKNNIFLLQDERATEYIDRAVEAGLITTKRTV